MPNYTPNLNLEKPLQGEFYNVDVFNANADKIDTTIGNILANSYEKPTGGIPLADVSPQITDRLDWYGNTSGATNDMTLNIPDFAGTLKAGTVIRFKKTGTSTGNLRLNFNGNGLKNILRSNGSPFVANNANGVYTVVYDGTSFILQGEGGGGNALASEILFGRTAVTNNGEIIGTMPNRGNFNLGLGVTVPPGYYSGGTTANGKRSINAVSTLTNFGGLPYFSLVDLPFKPSTIILTVSYNSVSYFKTYYNFPTLNNITFTSDSNSPVRGNYLWNVNNNGFNTIFSYDSSLIGRTVNYIIYE